MMATRFRSGIMILMAMLATGCQMQETVETAPTQVEAKGAEDTVSEKEVSEGNATNDKTQQETGDAIKEAADIHKMVGEAIISQSQVMYIGYECAAEGHLILDTEVKDGIMTVYAQTMYGEYQFHNEDYFVKSAGSGVIPCVMEFLVNEKGAYKLYAVQWPEDGSRYVQSIQEMFPEALWDTCISPSEDVKVQLTKQERAYASAYLKQLGREAEIGDYVDFEYTLPTEVGVSVEASNAVMVHEKLLGNYPNWIGTHELIEDGVRYVYAKEVDAKEGILRLTKTEYLTGRRIETYEYDWQTGELVTENVIGDSLAAAGTYDIMLTDAPALKLQDMLSSTYAPFEVQPGSYQWNYPEGEQMVSVVACGADPREYVEKKPSMVIPKYNGMEEVGYSIGCDKAPTTLVVKEYYWAAIEDTQAEPVSVQSYDGTFLIKLKPNRYYEIYAVWEEGYMETNGFYGNAEYALVTDV